MFRDRIEAGKKLAEEIKKKKWDLKKKDSIILGLPRGGVIVAAEISKELNLPLDIIVTRKIGSPLNPEYAIAAVGEHSLVLNPREEIDKIYLDDETKKERAEIRRRLESYRGDKIYPSLKNKKVLLVDDGLATGLTMQAAIEEVRFKKPFKIYLAVPVAPPETIENLKSQVDDYIVLIIESMFFAIGQFYENFEQVSDKEVIGLLKGYPH